MFRLKGGEMRGIVGAGVGVALVLVVLASPATSSAQTTGGGGVSAEAQEALALLQAGDWTGAVRAYRAIVAESPDDGLSWLRLGRGLTEAGEPRAALEALSRASDTGLQTPFIDLFMAQAHARLGHRDAALDALERIQPSPALGGGVAVTGLTDFDAFADEPRFQAVVEKLENAAWPCREDELSRQFDFWIGEWDVFAGGSQVGTNTIELMLGGCTLQENWTNARNRQGKSFNWVDRSTGPTPRWRQLWVDDSGNTLDYANGHFADGAMRFEGHTYSAQGDRVPQRMFFHHVHADTVRQVIEQSNDGGTTWTTTFNGTYVRRR